MDELENSEESTTESTAPVEGQTAPANSSPVQDTGKEDQTPKPVEQDDKSYAEIRKAFTQTSMANAELKRQIAEIQSSLTRLHSTFAESTKTPYDPQKFSKELLEKGPKYIEDVFSRMFKDHQTELESKLTAQAERYAIIENHNAVSECRRDAERYPDFEKLEPEMAKVLNDPASLVCRSIRAAELEGKAMSAAEALDTAYQFVRLQHSQDALAAAAAHGEKRKEAAMAREAVTAVPRSRATTPPASDPKKMTYEQRRAWFISQGVPVTDE